MVPVFLHRPCINGQADPNPCIKIYTTLNLDAILPDRGKVALHPFRAAGEPMDTVLIVRVCFFFPAPSVGGCPFDGGGDHDVGTAQIAQNRL